MCPLHIFLNLSQFITNWNQRDKKAQKEHKDVLDKLSLLWSSFHSNNNMLSPTFPFKKPSSSKWWLILIKKQALTWNPCCRQASIKGGMATEPSCPSDGSEKFDSVAESCLPVTSPLIVHLCDSKNHGNMFVITSWWNSLCMHTSFGKMKKGASYTQMAWEVHT